MESNASPLVLPKYVAFKGDNNRYLCLRYLEPNTPFLIFLTEDSNDSTVACEIIPAANGHIQIKQLCNGKYWCRSPTNWIWADAGVTYSSNTMFLPIQVDDATIALKNSANNHFCTRLTAHGHPVSLNAAVTSITTEAKLKVEEPVLRREIYDIKYDFDNARIYGETVVVVGMDFLSNHTDQSISMHSEIKYKDTTTTTWKAAFSLKSSVKATAQAGIPKIAEAKVVASTEIQAGVEWGKTETKSTEKIAGVTVSVPPKSKGRINLVAKQGTCDVAFTYKQEDTIYNGSTVITECHGIFTGSNMYSTDFDIPEFEPL